MNANIPALKQNTTEHVQFNLGKFSRRVSARNSLLVKVFCVSIFILHGFITCGMAYDPEAVKQTLERRKTPSHAEQAADIKAFFQREIEELKEAEKQEEELKFAVVKPEKEKSKKKNLFQSIKQKFSDIRHKKKNKVIKPRKAVYRVGNIDVLVENNEALEEEAYEAMQTYFKYENEYGKAAYEYEIAYRSSEELPYTRDELEQMRNRWVTAKEHMRSVEALLIASDLELNLLANDMQLSKEKKKDDNKNTCDHVATDTHAISTSKPLSSSAPYISIAVSLLKFAAESRSLQRIAQDTHSARVLHRCYKKVVVKNKKILREEYDAQLEGFAKLIYDENNFWERVFLSNVQTLQVLSAGLDVVSTGIDGVGRIGFFPAFGVSAVTKLVSSAFFGAAKLGKLGHFVSKKVGKMIESNQEDNWMIILKDTFEPLEAVKSKQYMLRKDKLIKDLYRSGEVDKKVDLHQKEFDSQLNDILQTIAIRRLTDLNKDYAAYSILHRLQNEKGHGPMFDLLYDLNVLNYEQLVILKRATVENEQLAVELIRKSLKI